MKKNKIVILDPGHGKSTPGKCSPDKLFKEWEWTRMFCDRLKQLLVIEGYTVFITVTDETDLALSTRARFANNVISEYNEFDCIFISIHNNAAGNGESWYNATGWEVYTTKGITNSDKLAECLAIEAENAGLKLRSDLSDGDKDKEQDFTVIYKAKCPAVLTENMFMDSKNDVMFLTSEDGINTLLNIHINGINNYFEQC